MASQNLYQINQELQYVAGIIGALNGFYQTSAGGFFPNTPEFAKAVAFYNELNLAAGDIGQLLAQPASTPATFRNSAFRHLNESIRIYSETALIIDKVYLVHQTVEYQMWLALYHLVLGVVEQLDNVNDRLRHYIEIGKLVFKFELFFWERELHNFIFAANETTKGAALQNEFILARKHAMTFVYELLDFLFEGPNSDWAKVKDAYEAYRSVIIGQFSQLSSFTSVEISGKEPFMKILDEMTIIIKTYESTPPQNC